MEMHAEPGLLLPLLLGRGTCFMGGFADGRKESEACREEARAQRRTDETDPIQPKTFSREPTYRGVCLRQSTNIR